MLLGEHEPSEKGYMLYDTNYMTFWKKNTKEAGKRLVVARVQGKTGMNGWIVVREQRGHGGSETCVLYCDCGHITFVKTQRTVQVWILM